MSDPVYDANPAVYDAINADWDYDRDLQFLREAATRTGTEPESALEIGCGTGEHTRRLAREYTVTAVDPAAGALRRAREKLEPTVTLCQGGLPALPTRETFDLVVAIRGVINHVPPDQLSAALDTLARRVTDDGVVVFDNAPLPPGGNEPGLDDGSDRTPAYVRVACHQTRADGRLNWREVLFLADGRVIRNTRPITPFSTRRLTRGLNDRFDTVEIHSGYGADDDRPVFVAADPVSAATDD